MRREFVLMGILVLLTVLAFSVQLTMVSAQSLNAGVQTGNYFEYTVSVSGSQATDSRAYGVTNATATALDVTDSLVTYSLKAQYQNGTQRGMTASVNVTNGQSENSTNIVIPWDLVAANLGVGEPTYPNSTSWANETVTINGRPTDHAFQTSSEEGGIENVTLDSYWDQATGVPVNVTQIDTVMGQGVTLNMNYFLVATNAWTTTVPEYSPEVIVIIMMALFGVAAATARHRKEISLQQTKLL